MPPRPCARTPSRPRSDARPSAGEASRRGEVSSLGPLRLLLDQGRARSSNGRMKTTPSLERVSCDGLRSVLRPGLRPSRVPTHRVGCQSSRPVSSALWPDVIHNYKDKKGDAYSVLTA